jgi:hypothetical protein
MPLYRCARCGWATTAFRVEAVRDHHADCPECLGTIRMVFYVGTPSLDPDPSLAQLEEERDRARERLSGWRAHELARRTRRATARNGSAHPSRRGS